MEAGANSAPMIVCGVDALLCIICDNIMTNGHSICVHMYTWGDLEPYGCTIHEGRGELMIKEIHI